MIRNLTPHAVTIMREGQEALSIPSEGLARVAVSLAPCGELDGIPTVAQTFGAIEGLPAPEDGVFYIVSALIVSAARAEGRTTSDLLTPADQVRGEAGQVIGCRALARN